MSAKQKGIPGEATAWVDIMRTGTFTPSNGKTVSVTSEVLANCITLFDKTSRRVPLVFGHPATDAPAYGWVSDLRVVPSSNGEVLQAKFRQVHSDVKTLVENGYYKNVSVSIGETGGLRHVGLLGAVQPAIPGLREVKFSESEEAVCLEFAARSSEVSALHFAFEELAHLKERERGWRQQEIANHLDALINQGNIFPYEREQILELATALDNTEGTVCFSSTGEALSLLPAFLGILSKRPSHMLFTEFTKEGPVWRGGSEAPEPFHQYSDQLKQQKQTAIVKNPAYLV